MTCRVDCTCKVCGRVHLHVTETTRKTKKPRPVDKAALALQETMRALALVGRAE